MVAEMTGSFSVVPGAIIAIGVASLLMQHTKVSIYRSQRLNRETAETERALAAAGAS
jgi:CIC family chloride channel protein